MSWLTDTWDFIVKRQDRFIDLVLSHLRLSLTALAIALVLYIPMAVLCSRRPRAGSQVVALFSGIRVIPSLALVFLFYPFLGFGPLPAIVALVVLAAPPLMANTFTGLTQVDRNVLEAASGLGMSPTQSFFRVQLPLAVPVIITGIRLAAIELIASATLASFVGAKSLGQWILTGISMLDTSYLLAGGIPIVAMVLAVDILLNGVERLLTPRGMHEASRIPGKDIP